jgi:hypothetical protein
VGRAADGVAETQWRHPDAAEKEVTVEATAANERDARAARLAEEFPLSRDDMARLEHLTKLGSSAIGLADHASLLKIMRRHGLSSR